MKFSKDAHICRDCLYFMSYTGTEYGYCMDATEDDESEPPLVRGTERACLIFTEGEEDEEK